MSTSLRGRARQLLPYLFLPATYSRQLIQPAVRILMYHRVARLPAYDQLTVTPERFDEQLEELATNFRVVSLADAFAELERGKPRETLVVVTFDDGYLDNLTNALPILRRHAIPATIFVTARFADGNTRHPRYVNESGRLHLDWSEIGELAKEPGITIGSHTLTHPFLSRLDASAARDEIAGSREEIGRHSGKDVEFFCYPSGDFTAREEQLVANAGYRAAVSVHPGANRNTNHRFALRRTEVTDRDSARELRLKLQGAYDPLHLLLHWRRERGFERARGDQSTYP
ncbi:MAG TPA: polysaccharide deacetylase family protein [Polyangiaceae bacterium]|nr:polysaccharide deacetylase family protein [Polyangiaceae bacterium]